MIVTIALKCIQYSEYYAVSWDKWQEEVASVKLSVTLIVIGVFLIADGMLRMVMGLASADYLLVLGGFLTGLLLGGYLLYRGIRRYGRIKLAKSE